MTVNEVLDQLKALGNEKVLAHNKKFGAGDNQFGVKMGGIRAIANKIKTDHELGKALWATGNVEARFIATLIMKPAQLSAAEVTEMAKSEQFPHVIDWLSSNVLKEHPDKEELRQQWMQTGVSGMPARLGWGLTSGRIARRPDGIDITAMLDRIETEMPVAAPEVQWTMNTALAQIGINHPAYRERALEIGERLGIFRDYPTSKGCVSPFAPIWINEMVKRQK
ncbi:DNA alkylation repair protein [Mucilaginibacter sp. 21P]|uniref:DNA alkylation repair protein n=1 Tax=Mucilaginibacter sp. 21P TaxID=2778902 RepID=UPI001C58DDC5|nr:DNA alkylation repair protein [Mucilaginibacter sp. 21P]QXV66118.1 DNA alkylation repair protein [Mucilaginibacter sp. 21P]